MSRQTGARDDAGETARPWALSRTQWIWVALVLAGVGLAFSSYELLNAAPPADRWPGYFATRPATGQLLQPLTGSEPYQTLVLKSWLDARIPFVPLLAIPYLSFLVIVPIVIPLLNLAAGSFRRFLTVGLALIVSQLVLDAAYILFQTYVVRNVQAGDGFGGWLVNQVWGNDLPFNGYPSGHSTWTTIGILALWRLRHRFPKAGWILMAWLCLVYPATVMLRQHYLMDVYAGIFVGFACYWACMFAVERPRLAPGTNSPSPGPEPCEGGRYDVAGSRDLHLIRLGCGWPLLLRGSGRPGSGEDRARIGQNARGIVATGRHWAPRGPRAAVAARIRAPRLAPRRRAGSTCCTHC